MNLYETMFIMQFAILLILLLLKLYNIMNMGEIYSYKISVLTFIIALMMWLIGFLIFMLHPEILIYNVMFNFHTWLLPFHVLFFIIELILMFKNIGQPIQAYRSNAAGTKKPYAFGR